MRAVSVHRDALVVDQPDVADERDGPARGRGGGADRLARTSRTSSRRSRRCSARPGSSPTGCSPPTPTSITCSARLAFPGPAAGGGRDDRAAPARRARRDRSARCAISTTSTTWPARAAEPGRRPGAPGARPARRGRPRAGAAPGRGPHRRRLAVFDRALGILVAGDYLSDVEIPMISPGGSRGRLPRDAGPPRAAGGDGRDDRARPRLAARARRTLRILDEDVDYLDALERGEERPALPAGRAGKGQRQIHAENLLALGDRSAPAPPGRSRWSGRGHRRAPRARCPGSARSGSRGCSCARTPRPSEARSPARGCRAGARSPRAHRHGA